MSEQTKALREKLLRAPKNGYDRISEEDRACLRELIGNLGWSFVECDEYEADDIIGTLSRQADETLEYDTYIIF